MLGSAARVTAGAITAALLVAASAAAQEEPVRRLPPALFDQDPQVRVAAVRLVSEGRDLAAAGKLASMARGDPFPEVRTAACEGLAALDAKDQLELLDYLALNDANADVRSSAGLAARALRGLPVEEAAGPFLPAAPGGEVDPAAGAPRDDEDHRRPTLEVKEVELRTRHFAFGLGTMGGYGIAALDLRGRIPTGAGGLPWIGIEVGGGWTPPTGYPIVSGLANDQITDDAIRWRLISGAAAVLLFFHRNHYVPIRGGFDVGQGPYFMLGYGFEVLNEEGFFGWGGEVGILYHPVMGDWVGRIVDERAADSAFWPVVPYARFVLHFYIV
jgi:hypothetical protein